MNENYEEVPNIISCKDLDYLSDMFTWNYGAYKTTYNEISSVTDEKLSKQLEKASNVFYESMQKILDILNEGGSNE